MVNPSSYTWKFRLSIPYDEFVPILKSASRPHSSTVPLPTLASSNLEALPLVGWAPRSAANGPLRVPSSRESRRNESECASSKRNQALTGCPHVFLLANSTRGGHTEKPSATQQQKHSSHVDVACPAAHDKLIRCNFTHQGEAPDFTLYIVL